MNANRKFPVLLSLRNQGQLALLLWGVVTLFLLRRDLYGLDEAAAKSLLLAWSIADQIASSVITFGTPDLRTLLFLPIGFLWAGNVFAAKILSILLFASAIWLLYAWLRRSTDSECALIACGLFLLSPIALEQIDSISAGIYLLAAFAIGMRIYEHYQADPKLFNGWYFAQMVLCAFTVSLHPAGLAYPLALMWSKRNLISDRKQLYFFFLPLAFVSVFVLLMRMGWGDLEWFQNPVANLASILTGSQIMNDGQSASNWLAGGIILVALITTVVMQYRRLFADMLGNILLLALLLGALVGDKAWSFIALAVILFYGTPLLLRTGLPITGEGFFKQRGLALFLLFVCSTFFMHADRQHFENSRLGALSMQDQLIKTLAGEAENYRHAANSDDEDNARPRFIVASQWPSRTMIACRCDTLPLPPAARDPQTQLANLHGVSYLLLDPKQTANLELARNLSLLGGVVETISLQPGGVLLHVIDNKQNQPGANHE